MRRSLTALPAIAVAGVVVACSSTSGSTSSGAAPLGSATPTAEPSAVAGPVTPGATAVASPSAAVTATATLAGCPSSRPVSALPVLARPPISPDDLLAMPDGSLWVSDPAGGTIVHLDGGGRLLQRIDVGEAPEGMVALGDGRIVLAEQTPNRLVALTPPATATTTVATLPPRGAADGVDGIGLDAAAGRLLVPDSPHGTLLAVATAGGATEQLAAGLGRDVSATVGPDGALWVTVEGSSGLWRVPAGGGEARPVGGLSQLDDVVSDGGLLYVTALVAGEVLAVDPRTGADAVLVTGIPPDSAQGLAVLSDGRLAVADSASGTVVALAPCG